MAGETEIERLVVRLTGDAGTYMGMLRQAQASTQEVARNVTESANRIEAMGGKLKGFASSVVSALGALGASKFLKDSFEAFADAEKTELKLRAILKANGREVESLLGTYKEFANAIQDVTTAEDDAVLAMIATAEQFGVTGDAAMRAVKNAIALADGNDEAAASYVRLMAMMEQGIEIPGRMLRLISPALLAIKDPTERLAKAQQLLAQRFEAAKAMAGSASGQIKQLRVAFGNLLEDFGKVVADGIKPFIGWLKALVLQVQQLSPEFKATVVHIAAIAAALLLIGPAIRIFQLAQGPVLAFIGLMASLAAQTAIVVANTAAWLVWKTVVLLAGTVAFLFNTQIVLWNALIAAATSLSALWTAGTIAATAATWLWNAALAVMDALLAPAVILAAAGTLVIIGGILVAAAAAAYGLYSALGAVWGVLTNLSLSGGALTGVASAFEEWKGILQDIFTALTTDMPLAWEMTKAAATLAVEQIKQLWPPLWTFIKEGFGSLSTLVWQEFKLRFMQALDNIALEMLKFFSKVLPAGLSDAFKEYQKQLNIGVNLDSQRLADNAKRQIQTALQGLAGIEDTEATKAARQALADLQEELYEGIMDKDMEAQKKLGASTSDLGDQHAKAAKEVAKFDAAIMGSVEAYSRIAAYQDMLNEPVGSRAGGEAGAAGGKFDAAQAGGVEALARADKQVDLLKDFVDLGRDAAKKPTLQVAPAGLNA